MNLVGCQKSQMRHTPTWWKHRQKFRNCKLRRLTPSLNLSQLSTTKSLPYDQGIFGNFHQFHNHHMKTLGKSGQPEKFVSVSSLQAAFSDTSLEWSMCAVDHLLWLEQFVNVFFAFSTKSTWCDSIQTDTVRFIRTRWTFWRLDCPKRRPMMGKDGSTVGAQTGVKKWNKTVRNFTAVNCIELHIFGLRSVIFGDSEKVAIASNESEKSNTDEEFCWTSKSTNAAHSDLMEGSSKILQLQTTSNDIKLEPLTRVDKKLATTWNGEFFAIFTSFATTILSYLCHFCKLRRMQQIWNGQCVPLMSYCDWNGF